MKCVHQSTQDQKQSLGLYATVQTTKSATFAHPNHAFHLVTHRDLAHQQWPILEVSTVSYHHHHSLEVQSPSVPFWGQLCIIKVW